jgi:hypothetical protein
VFVALLAEQMGRFSGVFNQPAEAGVAYSLAAFSLLYLLRTGASGPRWRTYLLWVLIVVGGLLTLSKVFVVGGIAVAAVMIVVDRANRWRMTALSLGTVGAAAAMGAVGLAGSWGASIMLNWYLVSIRAGDSPLYTLTAGRFGEAGSVGPPSIAVPVAPTGDDGTVSVAGGLVAVAREIVDKHAWFGVGARGLAVAYDSSWTESIVVGGLVGLALVIAVHLVLAYRFVQVRRALPAAARTLAAAVLVLVLGSSLGMPSLTGNREGTLLWIFVTLLLLEPARTEGNVETAAAASADDARTSVR